MNPTFKGGCAVIISAMFVVSGCASTGAVGGRQTALDRSINQCIGSLVVGAALGALIGSMSHGHAGKGAAIGAGVGAAACAVFVAINNKQDRARIRQNELAALQSGQVQRVSYVGNDGMRRTIQTNVEPASMPGALDTSPTAKTSDPIVGPCRKITTQISVQNKGMSNVNPGLTCRTASGNYVDWNGQAAV